MCNSGSWGGRQKNAQDMSDVSEDTHSENLVSSEPMLKGVET